VGLVFTVRCTERRKVPALKQIETVEMRGLGHRLTEQMMQGD
jgi:hypothetical protein